MNDTRQLKVDLRPWSAEDYPLLERVMGDPSMMEHLGGPETLEKIRVRHQRYLANGPAHMFVIILGSERLAAGTIGYWERQWQGQAVWETGWSVLPEFQGQGVATKATLALVEQARLDKKHRYLHAFPSVDNGASNAICRKAGFTFQGEANFEYPVGHVMRCNDWQLDLWEISE